MMNKIITLSIFLLLIFTSCGSKIESAKESLEGSWQVEEIFKYNSSTGLTLKDESGVGMFEFTSTQCDYSFTFDSKVEANSFDYEFQISKENAGFIKADRFDVIGEENYRVRFGDETSDAHQEATQIILEKPLENDSLFSEITIFLKKK